MALVQKEIKRITIYPDGVTEKQIRPALWTYSYNFKGKTAAEIGNDWDLLVGGIYVDSNGVTGGSNTEMRIKKDIPSLATAKKITISYTCVANVNSTNACTVAIGTGTGRGTGIAGGNVQGTSYTGICAQFYDGTNHLGTISGHAATGTYKPTITIDLVNKPLTQELAGYSTSSLILTDGQIATIRGFDQLIVYTSRNKSTISDVSIEIEL